MIKYEPWDMLKQMHKEMDNLFSSRFPDLQSDIAGFAGSNWVPAVDVKEEDDKFVIHADIPGVAPKDIKVNIENGVLTIKGEKKHERTESEKNFRRIERSSGSFFRQFSLPETVDPDHISAKSDNGVLELTIPKTSKTKSNREITVEG
ncbi:MAG: Hsp20/alpha crystallin family protein [Gammaproteobacteria bacterium]|nr:Hsp20/alpha crystallin family protein [Gammaproteobacteria bacterium]